MRHFSLQLTLLVMLFSSLAEAQTPLSAAFHPKAPISAEDFMKRAGIRSERGNRKGAIADFTKAIELKPTIDAYYGRGVQRLINADYDLAIADFSKAIEMNAQVEPAYLNRGIARKEKGDLDKAISDFTAAIRLDDKDILAYDNRSELLVSQGHYQSAIYDLNTIIEIDPEDASAYGNRALANLALGEDVRAEEDFARCFALNGSLEVEFKKAAAETRNSLEPERKAAAQRKIAAEFAQKEPENFEAQVNSAELNYQAELYDPAIEFFIRANKLRPNDYDVIVHLGDAYYEARRYSEAERWYVSALLKRPDDVIVRGDLAATFLMREPPDLERAIREYQRCLELDPKNKRVLNNLVVALAQKGNASEAQAMLEKLEKLDPSYESLPLLKETVAESTKKKP